MGVTMKLIIPLTTFSALAASVVADDSFSLLDQDQKPLNIDTVAGAMQYCEDMGGTLATQQEACNYFTENPASGDDTWLPVLGGNWIEIGAENDNYCQDHDIVCAPTLSPTDAPTAGPTTSPVQDPTASPVEAPTPSQQGGCRRPEYCKPYETGSASCMIKEGCPELVPNAYYPDPENCAGYCFSTGTEAPCRYEVVDLAAPLVVDPYGTTFPSGGAWSDIPASGKNARCTGNRGNPLDGTCGITQSQTNLWGHWGIPIPNLDHCKYWPDRDGGASGNLGTPPPPTNSFRRKLGMKSKPTNSFHRSLNDDQCEIEPRFVLCSIPPQIDPRNFDLDDMLCEEDL